ncbi:MAG: oligosaccharide flippase family protein [Blautia sp.]
MKKDSRMTEGSISRKIIFFAIPLFLGNLFQQLYNTADSLIVGNFLGSNALAAHENPRHTARVYAASIN